MVFLSCSNCSNTAHVLQLILPYPSVVRVERIVYPLQKNCSNIGFILSFDDPSLPVVSPSASSSSSALSSSSSALSPTLLSEFQNIKDIKFKFSNDYKTGTCKDSRDNNGCGSCVFPSITSKSSTPLIPTKRFNKKVFKESLLHLIGSNRNICFNRINNNNNNNNNIENNSDSLDDIEESIPPYQNSIDILKKLSSLTTPSEKLECIEQSIDAISQ
ncbi:hypothetical protein ACTA71_007549 [Dictyostelium dimigraforme]